MAEKKAHQKVTLSPLNGPAMFPLNSPDDVELSLSQWCTVIVKCVRGSLVFRIAQLFRVRKMSVVAAMTNR